MADDNPKPRKIIKANRKITDTNNTDNVDANNDMECEDSQEDEFEQENVIQNDEDSDEAAGEWESESDDEPMEGTNKQKEPIKTQVWNDQKDPLKDDEELEYDGSAYQMLHRSKVEWPCLSVDFLLKERSTA